MLKALFEFLSKNQFIAGIFLIGFVIVLYHLKETILVIFIAYIIVAALNPAVTFLRKKGVPKTLAVLLTFFITLSLFVLLIAPLVPFFVSQIQLLGKSFPYYMQQAGAAAGLRLDAGELGRLITPQQIGQNAFALAGGVFGGFFTIISTVAISFYLLLSYESAKSGVSKLFPQKYHQKAEETIEQVNNKLGAWLQGQFILSLVIGLLTWVSLTALQIPFALPLAVLAALFEIVPTVGPIIASIPAIIVALTISPNMALVVVALYIAIQLVENHFLVPRIMQRAVGLNPVIVIIGVIAGGKLLGIPGALLSVPFISLIVLIFRNIEDPY
jgi:predicted PurR-regulated permease PerM